MSEVALKFLLANLAVAIAILLVIALRKPARAAFGARLAYGLWLLVPLAALGSLLPPRVLEIARPAPTMTASYPPPLFAPDFFPAPPATAPADISALPPSPLPDSPAQVSTTWTLDPWALGIVAWLAGVLAMAIWLTRGQMRFLADARAGFAGPAVAGVFSPRIIVPADFEDRFESSERDMILAHEKIHLANNDARINALVALLRCVCWFNPLVHVAAHLMRIDQELACDATVVERHPRAKAVYASALLKAQLASRPLPLGCYWPAGTEHPLTERVEMLKHERPTRLRRRIGIAVLAVLALGAGASAWAVLPVEERFTSVEAPPVQLPSERIADDISDAPPAALPGNDVAVGEPGSPAQSSPQPAPAQPELEEPQNASPAPELKGLPWILQDRADPNAPRDLHGVVARIEWVNPATRIHVREEETGKAWVIETSTPNTLLRLGATKLTLQNGTPITTRGFAPIDKTCAEACVIYAHPSWMTLSGKPLSLPPSQTAPQPIRYDPQQSPPAPRSGSQELPPPPIQPHTLPVLENWDVTGSPPKLDAGSRLYLRGRIEKIEFRNATYVAFLRATSIARPFTDGVARSDAAYPNAELWELSPTNYFGDPDSIRADLVGKAVEINGVNLNTDCQPICRAKVAELILPRSSQVPQLRDDESLINQFGYWYDTNAPQVVRGKVERIEFSNKTFDAYIRSESRGALPSRLYQVRSEYRFPRGDIERALLDKTVVASGWRARDAINTFCDPVCGLYANGFAFVDRSRLTPTGAALVTPSPYLQRPRGSIFMSIADLNAPITVTGKVLRYVRDAKDENPVLWIEATGVTPASTFGAAPGTTWVVAGFPFDASDDLLNHTVAIRGFNVDDKRCQPQCMMAGDSLTVWE